MKNYRTIVPIVLVVMMALATYSLFLEYSKENGRYNDAVEQARAYSADGIMKDSLLKYKEALALYDTLDMRIEMCDMVLNLGGVANAISLSEEMINRYAHEPKAYTYMLKLYIAAGEYKRCFSLNEKATSMNVANDEFIAAMKDIEYVYELSMKAYQEVQDYGASLAPVKKKETWGYVDSSGALVIENVYASAAPFTSVDVDGQVITCAPVVAADGSMFYIDASGNKKYVVKNLSNCTYIGSYCEGVIVATEGEEYAYYDIDFNKLSPNFGYASAMNGGFAVAEIDERWYVINNLYEKQGEAYDEFVLDDKKIAFRNERAFGKQAGLYYLVDTMGNKVTGEVYEDAKPFMSQGYAAVKKDGKWGFIDVSGTMVIPPTYQDANSFSLDLAAVQMDGKWGFINMEQEVVIPCTYDGAKHFNSSGNAFVKEGEIWKVLKLFKYNF